MKLKFSAILGVCLLAFTPILIALTSGGLDPSFGNDGILEFYHGHSDWSKKVEVDHGGRILLGGVSHFNEAPFPKGKGSHVVVSRSKTEGALDPTFHTDGIMAVSYRFGATYEMLTLGEDKNNKITVVAKEELNGKEQVVIARYLSNGTKDTTFSSDGVLHVDQTQLWKHSETDDAEVLESGNILFAGHHLYTSGDQFLVKVHNTGNLDTTFATDGVMKIDTGAINGHLRSTRITSDKDENVALIASDPPYSISALFWLDSKGTLQKTVSEQAPHSPPPYFIGIDGKFMPDGRLVVAGYESTGSHSSNLAVRRYLPNGDLDPQFPETARLEDGEFGRGEGIALDDNGRILVAGRSLQCGLSCLVRFGTNGMLDPSFNHNGVVTAPFLIREPTGMALQKDGKLLVPGDTDFKTFVLARFFP